MKRIEPSDFTKTLPVVRLYHADLETLVGMMQRERGELTIEQGDVAYDSVTDLREHVGTELRTFRISSRHPWHEDDGHREFGHMSVTFNPTDVRIYASSLFQLEYHKVVAFLESHVRAIGRIPEGITFGVGALFYVLLLISPTILALVFKVRGNTQLVAFMFTFPAALYFGFGRVRLRQNLIILAKQHEHETFWKRHDEHILRAVYAGISSLITGLVVYWLTHK